MLLAGTKRIFASAALSVSMKRKRTVLAAVLVLMGCMAGLAVLFMRQRAPSSVAPAAKHTIALGTVRAADGAPIPRATVRFSNADETHAAVTDDDGNFRLSLLPGDYSVEVVAAGRTFPLGKHQISDELTQLTLKTDLPSETQQQWEAASAQYRVEVARLESRLAEAEQQYVSPFPPPPWPAAAPIPEPAVPEPAIPIPSAPTEPPVEPAPEFAEEVSPEEKRCENSATPCRVQVFFATDRNVLPKRRHPKREANFQIAFGGNRSNARQPMTYGWCDVTIPRGHTKNTGELDLRKGTYDAQNSVFIWDVIPAENEEEFIAKLRDRVDDDREREMLVFIHGYNVSFFEAARRTAQIHWDLGFRGAPAFFSWPSGGSILDYWADEASSEWASNHLREFLDVLAKRSGAKKIHLVAHSMGNRPLVRALAEIGIRKPECDPPAEAQFSQVIMAAPDLDRDVFLQLKDAIQSTTDRVTLYASKRDRAVLGSWILHRFSRLGVPTGKPPIDHKIEAIDATNASTGFLGHSYYGASILWDVKGVLVNPHQTVDERCTIDPANPAGTYPRFRRQMDPKKVPRWWRRVFRKPTADVITAECKFPRAAAVPQR